MKTSTYTVRVGNSIIGFSRESLVFFIEKAKEQFAREKERIAPVAHFKDRLDRFAHGRSFLKSNKSESLTVALF